MTFVQVRAEREQLSGFSVLEMLYESCPGEKLVGKVQVEERMGGNFWLVLGD